MNKKQEVGKRLKHFRKIKDISQKQLAELCGWGSSRVGNYEAGVRSINLDDAETLAAHLGIAPYQILFDLDELSNTSAIKKAAQPYFKASYPVISSVQAGMWQEAFEPYGIDDNITFIETTERVSDCSFWLKVEGESMMSANGISFPPGTMILVDPSVEAENGKLVVAKLDDVNEATFKKLVIDSGRRFLKPLNTDFPILPVNGNCKIVGVVVDAKLKLF
ncbi:helix-turn-helix domain-containing protein [Vibrio scophthalmi]|uniref:helix-turn-helix domain-containing protein n=1 Tax=Vibrio scophthalmi TaxID=45658 RepID=UPI0022844375|nr:S24 family peptidase [Vibrio scophthalmi]MCY9802669.1 helix-turn-helix domain-containing protein [Vibrio scophthalmi]